MATKQKIAITFEENKNCHETLINNDEPPMKNLFLSFLLGSVLTFGAVLAVRK